MTTEPLDLYRAVLGHLSTSLVIAQKNMAIIIAANLTLILVTMISHLCAKAASRCVCDQRILETTRY